ncbi:hypothetical protein NEOLEDRAFT_1180896 [Neolentinus lepideus HHB14362 ss-1]|uniref:Acid protease n=1 Tax=Neolentinus lepideus HHB14362 ss-1 TaxID=1314782 RepID=A0A165QJ20_9AGAM|nr:hypothetical protein NEOLEDRAFT_1180896 [Neolentinus lepideus HHB14362 ss-1]
MFYYKAIVTFLLASVAALVQAAPESSTKTVLARDDGYASINPVGLTLRSLDARAPAASLASQTRSALRADYPFASRQDARRTLSPFPLLAARAVPSTCATTILSGIVGLTNSDTGAALGYIEASANTLGEYGVTSDLSSALRISFGTPACASVASYSELQITTSNDLASFTQLGFITGFSNTGTSYNLDSGLDNYAYLGGVTEDVSVLVILTLVPQSAVDLPNSFSAATSIPEGVESAVRTWNPSTNALGVQWINSEGSVAPTYLMWASGDNVVVITGDVSVFRSTFGNDARVSLTLVTEVVS